MAHPLIQVNKSSWLDILNVMKDTLPFVISRLETNHYTASSIDNFVKEYVEIINLKLDDILNGCTGEITRYINSYQVEPRDTLDEFKGIYFLGVAISAQLERSGHKELKKLHQFTVLHLLNSRLSIPYDALRPQLARRIGWAISNGDIENHLGKYGWYLLYKCLYNAARDSVKP